MKNVGTFLLVIALSIAFPFYGVAQMSSSDQLTMSILHEMFQLHRADIDKQTIANTDLKSITHNVVCLRPDYNDLHDGGNTLTVSNGNGSQTITITSDDGLLVTKAKKDKLTVMNKNGETFDLPSKFFSDLMLLKVRETMIASYMNDPLFTQKQEEGLKQEAKEKVAQQRADALAAERNQNQSNLNIYQERLKGKASIQEGPIKITVSEKKYDGTIPYWRYLKNGNKGNWETNIEEKFILSPLRLPILKEKYRDKIKLNNSDDLITAQIVKLSEMQKDTFGIFNWNSYINLRTGEVLEDKNLIYGLWESTRYIDFLKGVPTQEYNGTASIQELLRDEDILYREEIIQSLIGEKVFLLDKMKYDEIIAIEETPYSGEYTVLYLKERGRMEYWKRYCVAVKWYEELQKLVGKKIISSDWLRYNELQPVWREDLLKHEIFTIERFDVADGKMTMTINDGRKSESVNALEYCGLLTYPINIKEEWDAKQTTGNCMLDYRNYLSYEDVYNTTPSKPKSVKDKEARDKVHSAALSAKSKKLKQHQYIGASVSAFLSEWPNARLVNTTNYRGNAIKVYRVFNHQLVFENGFCVSQTNY